MAEVKKWTSPAFFAESAVCHEQTAKRFFRFFGEGQAVFACKIGSCSRLYGGKRQVYLTISPLGSRLTQCSAACVWRPFTIECPFAAPSGNGLGVWGMLAGESKHLHG